MSEIAAGRTLYFEGLKKTGLCTGAAVAVGAALPYSFEFAFQTITYLGFAVALAEGLLSVFAEGMSDLEGARRKAVEGIETLIASIVLFGGQTAYLAFG